jgi:TolB-like protein
MKVYNSGERRDVNNVTVLGSRNQAAQPKPRQTDCWQIYLIGTMRVVGPLGEDALPPRPRKIRALLASLCLTQPRGLSRNRIMALLWDKADRQARRNLRDALLQLNVLTGGRARELFKADDEHIALNRDVCWIDAFEAPIRSLETLLDDLDGISAPFDDWLDEQRRLFKGRVREALAGELTALIEEDASADRRASAAERLIAFDRLSEVGVAALMKAHADLGQHAQALRDYEEFGRALHDDLKLAPPREIEALAHSVRLASRGTRLQAQLAGGDPIRADQDAKPPVRGPSIAVLPFRNPSGKREHEFAAEGLTDVLTSNLSRVPGFFVISRQSALTFKKSARSASDIGDLLGVRYILSGSLRFLGSQIYLTVELADAAGGIILHSWQHQHRFAHLIEAQTELAEGIVREIAPHLRAAELKRTYAKRPAQLDAYDFLLRAQEAMHNSAAPVFAGAEQLFHEALQCDPSYAAVLAWLAYWHVLRVGQGWSPDPAGDAQLAREFAQRAVDCDP